MRVLPQGEVTPQGQQSPRTLWHGHMHPGKDRGELPARTGRAQPEKDPTALHPKMKKPPPLRRTGGGGGKTLSGAT